MLRCRVCLAVDKVEHVYYDRCAECCCYDLEVF